MVKNVNYADLVYTLIELSNKDFLNVLNKVYGRYIC